MLISRGIGTIQKEYISWENSLGTEWVELTFHSQQVLNCKIAHMIPYSSVPAMSCDVSFREKNYLKINSQQQRDKESKHGILLMIDGETRWRYPETANELCYQTRQMKEE